MTDQTEGYDAIRAGAALSIPADRAQIAVSGPDRAAYLQGLLTNDIEALKPGSGCYAAWLTAQGRMTADMHVLEPGDMILLDVPASVRDSVLQRLDQFLFSENVQLADVTSSMASVSVHGPLAAAVVQRVAPGVEGLADWDAYRNQRSEFAGAPLVVARIDQFGVPGFTLYSSAENHRALVSALDAAGAVRASDDAIAAARVEAGYPVFGVDMDDEIIPLEAGIEQRAISFTKGCYVGQEVIIRVLHRGHGRVVRKLVGLQLHGDVRPQKGARIHAGDRDVGFVTSTATSPRLGAIALGYVHRDFLEAGTRVHVDTETGRIEGTVSGLPFASGA
jgi:folate-binding protein YgfZ